MVAVSFTPDANWIRPHDRHLLLAGSPLSLSRVTDVGIDILDAIEHGHEPPHGHEPLTDRLLLSGSIHRAPDHDVSPSDITVVIPSYVTDDAAVMRTQHLIELLSPLRVVVVDDCSPIEHRFTDCEFIRLDTNSGPAAARNIGAARASSPLLAFVDNDSRVTSDDIIAVSGHLKHGETEIVAPRVMSQRTSGPLARYERMASALDMGPVTTRVRSGARVPYVPSTCVVMFTDTFRASGGFDASLRFGEDVDFIWRAARNGTGVKYVADVRIEHSPRPTVWSFVRQRFAYGTSAGPLARRHSAIIAPFRGDAVVAAAWLTLVCGWWTIAAPLFAVAIVMSSFRLIRKNVDVLSALRVVATSLVRSGHHLADAVTRPWLIIALAGSVVNSRAMIALAVAFIVPAFVDYVRHPRVDPLTFVVLRALEHASYGFGVMWGALRSHSPTAIMPSLTLRR